MARRLAQFTPRDPEGTPGPRDESPRLWHEERSAVARDLLTSAVSRFAANGYHATTTRDIATGADLSPAALYVHFPSKEHVLYEIVRTGHQRALACAQGAVADGDPAAASRLRRLVRHFTAWHARYYIAARVCQFELSGLTAAHYDEIIRIRRLTSEVFHHVIERGITEGAFAPADAKRLVRGLLSLSIDLVRWYRLDGPDSPEQVAELYAGLALRMVQSEGTAPDR